MCILSSCKEVKTVRMKGVEHAFDEKVIDFVKGYKSAAEQLKENSYFLIGIENENGQVYRHIEVKNEKALNDFMEFARDNGLHGYKVRPDDCVIRSGYEFNAIVHN